MFQWDKSINALDVAAVKVVHLFRSMREVQLALPGVPAQEASAFLCQFQSEGGIGTVAAFHLHKSRLLTFYCSAPRVVPEQSADSFLDQGLNFVESMGFLMTDQDIHLLNDADKEMFWSSLPLVTGLLKEGELSPVITVETSEEKLAATLDATGAVPASVGVIEPQPTVAGHKEKAPPAAEAMLEEAVQKIEPESGGSGNVDDLLVAVEAMRAKRPGLRARKIPPTAAEMARRRQQLSETVGRILAAL